MEQNESVVIQPKTVTSRITSIDVARGLVMVIMALDHVRDLLHTAALTQNPADLATTTPAIFMTRWITHLCAPTFVFLSGMSAYLSLQKQRASGPPSWSARSFLLKRGLVLILLELTIINFAFWFDLQFRTIMLQVIYAIGGGFVLLAFLSRWPARWLGILGLVIIFGHDLLLLVPPFDDQTARFIWSLFFRTDLFNFSPQFVVLVGYPLIPWLGIMLAGYGCGQLMERPAGRRQQVLLRIGLGAVALFVVLRLLNVYGDVAPWSAQKDGLFTLLSFINVSKYPPSLQYTLLLVGLGLLVMALAEGADNAMTRVLTVYGKVPMFYYILHWYLVHLSMIAMSLFQGYSLADIPAGPLNFGRPDGAGVSLPVVYLVWITLVAALYPLCRWYGRYKAAHPEKVLLRYI
ncbi:hypothetical protein BN8_01316 [Fibrisoma limi BUZ 3]|uniref:Heparan-alpha-glucosaminide N-acetyltransferase catalytic domain-containing protein n=1 Tax=Fibrisoma limi BUZ 3 TaxID=1185876 RepID=I2GEK0_9BACT|nr:heparan-alpha-glucosaminide N-acetyltransferase domain-containing protein [Fibrisoma limi]CCH52325.1 hypothetical protein BN8_01316 [Fibrisoma limi BUZ 3]